MNARLFAMVRRATTAACLAVALFAVSAAWADVTLPRVISDGMVLQRDAELPIWGKAAAGERVTVKLADSQATATADKDGHWMVRLPALPAGGPHTMSIQGNNSITLKNVLIGEVWVCSGQSNMEWPMSRVNDSEQEIASANYPQIRLFRVTRKKADEELDDVEATWQATSPKSVEDFSAVGFLFGRYLHKHLNVPIGLIESAWGGTPAEHWTPASAFAADASLKETSDHPHAQEVMKTPSVLYNGMIAPLIPYAIRGAIWYQGESNVPMGEHYHKLFSSMITGWRNEWGQGDFPFLYVQIAPWKYEKIDGWPPEGCPLVREGQLQTLALPNTGMVVTMDIGNVEDIHPTNKQEVGRRLGLAARAIAYGESLVYSGPVFKSMTTDGDRAVAHFDHVGGGLMADSGDLTTFEIAGDDGKFVPAKARIDGDTVVVQSAEVAEPKAVRYAWKDDAVPNLFNKEGLPASPFRAKVGE